MICDVILKLLQNPGIPKEPASRLFVVLVMVLVNLNNGRTTAVVLAALQYSFAERYFRGRLPRYIPADLLSPFLVKYVQLAQAVPTFAQVMNCGNNPLIILKRDTQTLTPMVPSWTENCGLTTVILDEDSSGWPVFSVKRTIFDNSRRCKQLLRPEVLERLKEGNLHDIADILSREEPVEGPVSQDDQAVGNQATAQEQQTRRQEVDNGATSTAADQLGVPRDHRKGRTTTCHQHATSSSSRNRGRNKKRNTAAAKNAETETPNPAVNHREQPPSARPAQQPQQQSHKAKKRGGGKRKK